MSLKVGSIYRSEVEAQVVAEADIVVVGGGTAGCVAALAAARNGAKTLLVERYGHLGGMMTEGNVGLTVFTGYPGGRERKDGKWLVGQTVEKFADTRNKLREDPSQVQIVGGIPLEIADRLLAMGAGIGSGGRAGTYVTTECEAFKALLFTMMEEAGVELLLHSWTVDVIKEDNTIKGVVVENKSGRQVLLGKVVIDTTGDGDVSAKAGVPFNVGVAASGVSAKAGVPLGMLEDMGMMYVYGCVDVERLFEHARACKDWEPTWPTFQNLEEAYSSYKDGDMVDIYMPKSELEFFTLPVPGLLLTVGCATRANGLSASELTRAEIAARKTLMAELAYLREKMPGFENASLVGVPQMSPRETRVIVGEYVLKIEDLLERRDFEDGIGRGGHPIDVTAGIPDSLMATMWSGPANWSFRIPYRCLVPQKIENLLVAGRCISTTHEAFGCTRPTAQCMVTGQAAGTAGALCVKNKVKPRHLEAIKLRKVLVEQGVIL